MKQIAKLLAGAMLLAGLCGCAAQPAPADAPNAKADEPTVVTFWYHDGNPTSNPIFEELIKRFEAKNPQYKIEYVGLPVDAYLQKYNTAIATNTVPDVISVRDMDLSALYSQEAVLALDDEFANWEEKDKIDAKTLATIRNTVSDGKLYCLPEYLTMGISWYNKQALDELGVQAPKSIDEFMALCEEYADPSNNKYFYSLRGGAGSMENLFDFLFTYAGQDKIFDDDGNCVMNGEKFVEGFEKYAGIYWNGWTSKDSVTNGFKEIVAEFGSKTSNYITHNSSSLPEHKKNLGEGNFMNSLPVSANGTTVTKGLSYLGFGVMNGAKNKEGGLEFVKYLASEEGASYLCEMEGRIPVNSGIYEHDWYKADPYLPAYADMLVNPNVKFVDHAIWLPQWNEFRSKLQEPDLQAVLMKKKTAKEALDGWAEYLTKAQKDYLASK